MNLFEWLKLGSELKGWLAWVESYLITAKSIDGGMQFGVTYWGITLVCATFYINHRRVKRKFEKLLIKKAKKG
jgi:uncharacterized membrane protein (DUF485 family)